MKKRVLAAFMAVMMIGTILTGCGSGGNDSAGSGSGEQSQSSESTDDATQGSEDSSAAEADAAADSGETAEIVFAYMTQNNIPEAADLQRIEDLINAYTVEKINTKVDLVLFSNADYMNQVNLMLASGEQIDIFQAYATSHLPYIQDGTALDITGYLDNELKETKETIYDGFLKPTTVDGKVYGILNMGSNYVPGGFTYRSDIAEELGIDMSKISSPQDLEEVFATVKEAYPDMIVIDPNRANALFETYLGKIACIDPLGGDITSAFSGVAYQDDPTVVNMFESKDFIDLCNLTHSWYEKGYFASDAATTTATTAELLMSGNCFGTFCGLGNPKIAAQYTTNYGHSFDNVQISESLVWAGSNNAWMVNSSCKNPSAACKFMNLLYTDAYLDNLLVYGEEGVDYVLNEEGFAVAPEGYTDLNSVAYTDNMNYYFWGNKWITYPVPGGLNAEEAEKQMALNYAGKLSNYYGFLFDFSDLQAEYTACQNIANEYKKALWVGAVDVEQTLGELNERLYAAGMDKLMESKQAQFDEWLSQQ